MKSINIGYQSRWLKFLYTAFAVLAVFSFVLSGDRMLNELAKQSLTAVGIGLVIDTAVTLVSFGLSVFCYRHAKESRYLGTIAWLMFGLIEFEVVSLRLVDLFTR